MQQKRSFFGRAEIADLLPIGDGTAHETRREVMDQRRNDRHDASFTDRRFSRRAALLAATGAVATAAVAGPGRRLAAQTTPVASPFASPLASPVAADITTPVAAGPSAALPMPSTLAADASP